MGDGPEAEVSLQEVKAALGALLLLWSLMERELNVALSDLGVEAADGLPHSISTRIGLWKSAHARRTVPEDHLGFVERIASLLLEALTFRNAVCHGLVGYGAESQRWADEDALHVEFNGERRRYRFAYLDLTCRRLEHLRWMIGDLTHAAVSKDAKLTASALGAVRQRWRDRAIELLLEADLAL